MECETVRELLGNYIDEDLTDALRHSVDRHISGCASCSADLATLTTTVAALGSTISIEEPSPWFADRLLHRLAQVTDTSLPGQEAPAKDLQLGLW